MSWVRPGETSCTVTVHVLMSGTGVRSFNIIIVMADMTPWREVTLYCEEVVINLS